MGGGARPEEKLRSTPGMQGNRTGTDYFLLFRYLFNLWGKVLIATSGPSPFPIHHSLGWALSWWKSGVLGSASGLGCVTLGK